MEKNQNHVQCYVENSKGEFVCFGKHFPVIFTFVNQIVSGNYIVEDLEAYYRKKFYEELKNEEFQSLVNH